jgi:hypothetical protein
MEPPTDIECRVFLENPKINPRTGKSLYRSGRFYKMLLELCKKKSQERIPTPEIQKAYSKRDLNAMARTIVPGYTKMTNDVLLSELSSRLKTMNITLEQRYRQVFGKEESKKKNPESSLPSVKKRKTPEEIIRENNKVKLCISRNENDTSTVKAKISTDIAKIKGKISGGDATKIAGLFLADQIDKRSIMKEILQNNYVVLYSITNQGIRFHIPTSMDEINYGQMTYNKLPFELDPNLPIQLDEKIGESYVMYHRMDEQEMNLVGDYDIFDMKYVRGIRSETPIKRILQKIYAEVTKDIRSV